MDTDFLSSGSVFVAFILLFSYLSLAHYSGDAEGALVRSGRQSRWARAAVPSLRHASVIAIALSGLALVHSVATTNWWPISFVAFGLVLGLIAVDRTASTVTSRNPGRVQRWCRPLVWVLSAVNPGSRSNGARQNGEAALVENGSEGLAEPAITEEDLVSLDQRDREMLRSIVRLDITMAREVMIPRLDMHVVAASSSLTEVAEIMIQSGHSRLPVYEGTLDNILGLVHSRDVMSALVNHDEESGLRQLVRPAFIIPETKRLDDLLEELQDGGIQMAVVVDEYGGTEGLITMEDLLEEIVGEIEDEFTRAREPQVVQLPDGAALVDAGVTTEDVERLFGTPIDSPDVDTVGGLVFHTLGKIPQLGDVIHTDHLRIEVTSILGRRLRKVRIERVDSDVEGAVTK